MKPSRQGQAVIDDGYTRQAYLEGVPFTTPPVRFSYRPILVKKLAAIRREMSKSPVDAVVAIQAKSICSFLQDWDAKDAKGEPVKLEVDNMTNVDPIIFDGVSGIILGLRYTDIDPEWTKSESDTESQRSIEEIFGGDIGKAEADDIKN